MAKKQSDYAQKTLTEYGAFLYFNKIKEKEFYRDVESYKRADASKQTINRFETKYKGLFDGTFSTKSSRSSFLGSYRRAVNPKNIKNIKNNNISSFGYQMRTNTVKGRQPKPSKRAKKGEVRYGKDYTDISKKDGKIIKFKDVLYIDNILIASLKNIKDVKNIKQLQGSGLFMYQEVHYIINYNLYMKDARGNWIKQANPDTPDHSFFITFPSKISTSKTLVELRNVCQGLYDIWIAKMSEYNYMIDILDEKMRIIRIAE